MQSKSINMAQGIELHPKPYELVSTESPSDNSECSAGNNVSIEEPITEADGSSFLFN